jgi:predicted nuclease of restriction endonuclease-like (RecB) superfamily
MKKSIAKRTGNYDAVLSGMVALLENARRASARTVNAIMTATYWELGRRIVEYEQKGEKRAEYGKELLELFSRDLTARFGRGFSYPNVNKFRQFYLAYPHPAILSTLSRESSGENRATPLLEISGTEKSQTLSGQFEIVQTVSAISPTLSAISKVFPLPWSHCVRLLAVKNEQARAFYETEALRGGWSVRQLDRQISTQFYERTALSRHKAAMLAKGAKPQPGDLLSADKEIKDPLVLEFLGLKDEYSELELEAAIIRQLETFLLELGGDFAFVGRQRRLRIDDEWYRVDLIFFHRRLRCLVVIDLKLGKFTHADAGQMHLYLNYTRAHWTQPGENPPVGLILCATKGEAMARYATEGLPNKMLVREYLTTLPAEKLLAAELTRARRHLEARRPVRR